MSSLSNPGHTLTIHLCRLPFVLCAGSSVWHVREADHTGRAHGPSVDMRSRCYLIHIESVTISSGRAAQQGEMPGLLS